MTVYTLQTGAAPLLISIPHLGTTIPEDLLAGMHRDTALRLDDTDWHLDRLLPFLASCPQRTDPGKRPRVLYRLVYGARDGTADRLERRSDGEHEAGSRARVAA